MDIYVDIKLKCCTLTSFVLKIFVGIIKRIYFVSTSCKWLLKMKMFDILFPIQMNVLCCCAAT